MDVIKVVLTAEKCGLAISFGRFSASLKHII